MEHPWDKDFPVCSNEDPRVTNCQALTGTNFLKVYLATKKFTNLFLMNYLANCNQTCWKNTWGLGIQICSNKGDCPFWDTARGKKWKICINL